MGLGEISKKLNISDCKVSAEAKAKIEKAGGSVK
ncbi:MAG: uL15m family ribosomal protein [Candidatus Paceibacterota bacterium]